MKTKRLKRKQKAQPGGSLEPVGSELVSVKCPHCGHIFTETRGRIGKELMCMDTEQVFKVSEYVPNAADEP